ncbi:LemA family protein [Thiomicrorhabdus sp. ZW0627]|uniref:LemA family protein n=1 Tax=Thiomicrorhabdus sp. ZW0627 TaxID=3039774 RepID=UPI0024365930|nr:LemA family protein [Thiomicrorhabdus sp. ZW0627]MDG6773838.1 LemA family protein [Thiomicrorhabdus sp. ZW0627]
MFDFTSSFWVDWLVLSVLFIVSLYVLSSYSSVRRFRRDVQLSFSALDALFKQRDQEVPKLVIAVQKYQLNEQALFTKLAKARLLVSEAMKDPEHVGDLGNAESHFQSALKKLLALAEEKVESDALDTVEPLIKQIRKLESEVVACCTRFNRHAQIYNSSLEKFPSALLAKLFGWKGFGTFKLDGHQIDDYELDSLFQKYKNGAGHV